MNQKNQFKENIDLWIKDINRRLSELEVLAHITRENTDNIEHNYELIYELKDQIEELKQEINAMKLTNILLIGLFKMEEEKWQKAEQKNRKNLLKI